MLRVPDRHLSDSGRDETIEIGAVAGRPDSSSAPTTITGTVIRFSSPGKPADAGGIEKNAAQRRAPSPSAAATAVAPNEWPTRMILPVSMRPPVLRHPLNGLDEAGQGPAIGDPRPMIRQLQRNAVHAPGRHVHRLEGMIFLRIVVAVEHDNEGGLAGLRAQVEVRYQRVIG